MEGESARLARRWYDLFNGVDLDVIDEIVAPDFVSHEPGTGTAQRGPASVRSFFSWYRATFSGARWTIDDLMVAGDRVVVRGHGESTYAGDWHGIPASGQRVTESCINIFRISGGKIREIWFEVSDLHVAYQLGAFPAREASATNNGDSR